MLNGGKWEKRNKKGGSILLKSQEAEREGEKVMGKNNCHKELYVQDPLPPPPPSPKKELDGD